MNDTLDMKQWCQEARDIIAGFRRELQILQGIVKVMESFPEQYHDERYHKTLGMAKEKLASMKAEEPFMEILETIRSDLESVLIESESGPGPTGPGGESSVQEQPGAASEGQGGAGDAGGGGEGPDSAARFLTPISDEIDAGVYVSH